VDDKIRFIQKIGNGFVSFFHHLALFGIGATIVWSAVHEYLKMLETGHATLEEN